MKKKETGSLILYFSPALLLFALLSCIRQVPDGKYFFEIYATNDVHGRMFDSLYNRKSVNPYSMSTVSCLIGRARERVGKRSVVLLDAGDMLQGDNSVYYYNFVDTVSQHIWSKIANYMQYDALAVGNHDVEAGHAVYERIKRELKSPYLAANAIDTKRGDSYFTPYTILDRGGDCCNRDDQSEY